MIPLKKSCDYSTDRIDSSLVSLDNFITTDNLLQNKQGVTKAIGLPPQGKNMPKYSKGDILVANIRPYLKKIWFASNEGGCSADVLVYKVNKDFDPKFIYYAMFRDDFFIHTMKGSKGTKMPRGDKNQMMEFLIPDFSITTQKKIASILSSLDAKIELNNRINSELEAMAKTLYDYWFVQFDFPNEQGKPYKSSGGKMVYSPELKREIPEGWVVKEINDCVELIIDHRGKTPKKLGGNWSKDKDGIIALSAKIVKGGKLNNLEQANRVSEELYNKWMPIKLQNGDILMTSEAPAGEFYFIQDFTKYCLSQRLFALRANQELLFPTYFYYELSKGHGYSQILGSLSGSTVFGIRQDVLRTVKVVVPERSLQEKFNKVVLPQLREIKQLEKQNLQLSSLRDWLLPMLMNGQVTVKEAEERIEQVSMAAEAGEEYKGK